MTLIARLVWIAGSAFLVGLLVRILWLRYQRGLDRLSRRLALELHRSERHASARHSGDRPTAASHERAA